MDVDSNTGVAVAVGTGEANSGWVGTSTTGDANLVAARVELGASSGTSSVESCNVVVSFKDPLTFAQGLPMTSARMR